MARSPSSPRRSGAAQPEMASLTRSIRCLYVVTRPPTRLLSLGDDILLEIFVRIDSFADLACASSACSTFRRIIADRSFLRRYRSLHPPLLLGIIYYRGFQRAKGAHLNAAAAHVLSCAAAGFPFGYLPPGRWNQWDFCDVRDGRVLLKSSPHHYKYKGVGLLDLAVCDPIFQRYFLLPPITEDLLASVQIEDQNLQCFNPALVPAGDDDDDDETSFKVIGWTYCATKTVAFVFSRCSGSWIVGTSIRWDALGLKMPQYYKDSNETFNYAYGCFFWRVGMGNKLLKLDMKRMKFSKVDLPPEILNPTIVAEAGENKLVMVGPIRSGRDLVCYCTTPQNESEGANVWQVEDRVTVPLHSYLDWYLNCATEGYISLIGVAKDRGGCIHSVCFSLESRTMKFERVNAIGGQIYGRIYPYFRFPVFMSPRRI